jgi:predicted Rossmann fold flavoprotein
LECSKPNARIHQVERTTEFVVRAANAEFRAAALVVATGGLSIPKIGATPFGYDLARQFGLAIREPWPGLVPLTLNSEDCSLYCDLAGVSADVIASVITQGGRQQFREKMLITHRGLSGPAILQISSYWKKPDEAEPQPILIDLVPGQEVTAPFHDPALRDVKTPRSLSALRSELRKFLSHRLADRWLHAHAPASWTNQELVGWEKQLHAWAISPAGTEGYEKAEVTAGGVDTGELSARTMESRKVPGLFFVGELVDVTGHLGGFSFQWAWASGAAAGRAL